MHKKFLGAAVALILIAFSVIPALAADVVVTGTVLSVDTTAGTFEVSTDTGRTLTVTPPAGFDLSTLIVGDTVQVAGDLTDTVLTATSVSTETPDVSEDQHSGFYCTNPEAEQPGLAKLAVEYNADYSELLKEFCSGHGVGEIKLALQTSQTEGAPSAADLLAMKDELGGWGKVWQELGLVGNGHGHSHDATETAEPTETETETETVVATETETPGNQGANDHANGNSEHGNTGIHGNSGHGNSGHGHNGGGDN